MRNFWRKIGLVLLAHLNAVAFFSGFALSGYGVSRWSPAAACVAAGLVLMLIAAWPFLHTPKRKSQ